MQDWTMKIKSTNDTKTPQNHQWVYHKAVPFHGPGYYHHNQHTFLKIQHLNLFFESNTETLKIKSVLIITEDKKFRFKPGLNAIFEPSMHVTSARPGRCAS